MSSYTAGMPVSSNEKVSAFFKETIQNKMESHIVGDTKVLMNFDCFWIDQLLSTGIWGNP